MAAQGKCPGCRAAFNFSDRRGFPACPHCASGTLVQTTHEYSKGPRFNIGPGLTKYPQAGHPDALDPTVRPLYYRVVLLAQAIDRHIARIIHLRSYVAALESRADLPDYDRHNLTRARADLAVTETKLGQAKAQEDRALIKHAAARNRAAAA
jgi:hypothetical protein